MLALWLAWLLINIVTFALYGADKRRARRRLWRIPERVLLTATWLMGGVGAYAGMQAFRHKTKHIAFQVSAPIGAILSLLLMLLASARLLNLI